MWDYAVYSFHTKTIEACLDLPPCEVVDIASSVLSHCIVYVATVWKLVQVGAKSRLGYMRLYRHHQPGVL